MKNLTLLVAVALSLACVSSQQSIRQTALSRASFDLNCPETSLEATQLGSTTHVGRSQHSYGAERTVIGVRGCDQKAVYVVECSQADVCNAYLNADTKNDSETAR